MSWPPGISKRSRPPSAGTIAGLTRSGRASRRARSAPRKWPPMPWIAENRVTIRPIQKAEAQTCCGAKAAGLRLAKAHMEKAGDACMPNPTNP